MRIAIGSAMMLPIDNGHDGLEVAPHEGAPPGDAQGGWVLVHADYLCLCSACCRFCFLDDVFGAACFVV